MFGFGFLVEAGGKWVVGWYVVAMFNFRRSFIFWSLNVVSGVFYVL